MPLALNISRVHYVKCGASNPALVPLDLMVFFRILGKDEPVGSSKGFLIFCNDPMPRPSYGLLRDAVYFWNADQLHGEFSQWYPRAFTVEHKTYPTAEHYMMCAKARLFGDVEIEEQIRVESSPEKVRDLGRRIQPFDRDIWDQHKFQLVCAGNRAKFSDPGLKEVMLATGDRLMVEASPVDRIWGQLARFKICLYTGLM